MHAPPLLAMALLSASALGYEVLLLRLLSIIQWHHFAYMMISVALLGYGAAGTAVALAQRVLVPRFHGVFMAGAVLFGLSAIACFTLAQHVPFNPLEIVWDARQPLRLLWIYLLLFVPFFCAALCICLTFTCFQEQIHRIYAFDILGAGIGSLAIVVALFVLTPVDALRLLGGTGIAAGALACGWHRRKLAAALLALAVVLPAGVPERWIALAPSEYKELSQTLRIKDARAIAEAWSPLGLLTVVDSPTIPLRHAPGLSLNATLEPPAQLAIFTDGDGLSALNRYDGRREPLAYLDYLTSALPYHLLRQPRVLVLGSGAGTDVLQALYHGARAVDAIELNPQVIDLVQRQFADFSGRPYSAPNVRVLIGEARGLVASRREPYDLIQIALLDSFGTASGGLHALSENYLYTEEALAEYLRHLAPGGLLAITRWITLPPRDIPRLLATAAEAIERDGKTSAARRIVMIRGWKTATLLVGNRDFSAADVAALQAFCRERSFDLAYYPGMTAAQANRYNLLDQPYFFDAAQALLSGDREGFLARYKFDVRPTTDDRPYFFHFFKWRSLPELLALKAQGSLSMLEWGYPVLIATLLQASVAAVALILLPLWVARHRQRRSPGAGAGRFELRVVAYFAAIGLAFMFVEIAFIQKFTLFLSHPLYSVAVTLSAFLIFAGLGSRYSARLQAGAALRHPLVRPVLAICALALLYLAVLPPLFQLLAPVPTLGRFAVCAALVAPLAFAMGMPFPLGLGRVSARAEALVPIAWGVNACVSVVAAVLATLLAIHLGFTVVLLLALVLYVLAGLAFP
ncbi:spermine/spermidine synthase domain-containing protein [Pseudomonas schmalbachii]|uniref:SAM-dependent methyltransferase n=1 Tax=Pseudomonas schmalbachii TaxID=2816993 RepID=A0ABS3TRA3_9PSED|nr:SAM-dependent methyltransferase [Pseudomonas schmalbachii]MBO3275888.1 SAM-dependent methyltransferase [Pseudomonas schmalbachii]